MEGAFIWRECLFGGGRLFGGGVYLEGVFIWRGRLFGGGVYLEGAFIWRGRYVIFSYFYMGVYVKVGVYGIPFIKQTKWRFNIRDVLFFIRIRFSFRTGIL